MRLALTSRFLNVVLVLGDSAVIDDDDAVELVSNTGCSFGFSPALDDSYYEDGDEDG